MTGVLDRIYNELVTLREYNGSLASEVGRQGERIDGVGHAMGRLEKVVESRQRSHSDRFERVEKRIDQANELGERRVGEVLTRVDERLDSIGKTVDLFVNSQTSRLDEVEKQHLELQKQDVRHDTDRKWVIAITSGVSALASGIIVAVVSSLLGGSCANSHHAPAPAPRADVAAVGRPDLPARRPVDVQGR